MDIRTADRIQAAVYALYRITQLDIGRAVPAVDRNRIRPAIAGLVAVLEEAGYLPYLNREWGPRDVPRAYARKAE